MASIVKIPRRFRDNEQNIILLRLWHSPRSPTADILLGRVVKSHAHLMTTGIDIEISNLGKRNSERADESLFSPESPLEYFLCCFSYRNHIEFNCVHV